MSVELLGFALNSVETFIPVISSLDLGDREEERRLGSTGSGLYETRLGWSCDLESRSRLTCRVDPQTEETSGRPLYKNASHLYS